MTKNSISKIDLVRVSSLDGVEGLCAHYQLNYSDLLANVGLSLDEVRSPDLFIKYIQVIALLNEMERITGCDHIGLKIGAQQSLGLYGTMGYILENSPSVGDALAKFQTHFHTHQTSAEVSLNIIGDDAHLRFTVTLDTNLSTIQSTDLAVMVGVNILRKLTDNTIRFKRVELAHGYTKNTAIYRKYFGLNPVFNASSSTLSFDKKYLQRRIEKADKQLLDILSEHLIQADINFVDEIPIYVEGLVRQQLNSGALSIHNIAAKLNMSARTLQRHLQDQNLSFRKIVDQVRNKIAHQYLLNSSLSLGNISEILQYNYYSEFTRAFTRLNGISPRDYRVKFSARKHLSRTFRR